MSKSAEQIAADYQSSVPNTNSLSERLAAAHRRNVQAVTTGQEPVVRISPPYLTAKQYAYESGIKLLEPLCLRVEELERDVQWLKEELVRQAAPKSLEVQVCYRLDNQKAWAVGGIDT